MLIYLAYEDAKLGEQLGALLLSQNHVIERLAISNGALEQIVAKPPQLMVFAGTAHSAMLALLKALRADARLRPIPVLCVDPKNSSAEGIALLDAGADDFINRPFNGQIFVARVRTLLRRRVWAGQVQEEITVLEAGALQLRLVSRQATLSGRPLELTRLEFDLLSFLLRQMDRVCPRPEILQAVWNYPAGVETRTLEKHVEMLRRKLGVDGELIETVHGVGYRLVGSKTRAKAK